MAGDYTATGGGLKFKGAGVDKKKKKKKPKSTADEASSSTDAAITKPSSAEGSKSPSKAPARSLSPETAENMIKTSGSRQKTEAEKRHEEMRKKRLEERLKREGGVKTHKERVEELNRYLSETGVKDDAEDAMAAIEGTGKTVDIGLGKENTLPGDDDVSSMDLDNEL